MLTNLVSVLMLAMLMLAMLHSHSKDESSCLEMPVEKLLEMLLC